MLEVKSSKMELEMKLWKEWFQDMGNSLVQTNLLLQILLAGESWTVIVLDNQTQLELMGMLEQHVLYVQED